MQTDRRPSAGVREPDSGRPLADGLDPHVLTDVAGAGVAVVRGALPWPVRERLVAEAEAASHGFLCLPDRINGVVQRADQLTARIGDPAHPALNDLIAILRAALADQPRPTGVRAFVPTEARYMRYTGRAAGLGFHRDGKCYALLVCVFSLAGSAPFRVCAEDGAPLEVLVHAGDLVLLRAPGFAGDPDGRPRHAVGAPLAGDRVSLTLRMVRAHPRAAPAPSWPGADVAR
ncbi:MAG: hypothetical protein ACT4PX_08530 [Actinomycetota bacterium]